MAGALRLAVRLARDDGWSPEDAGRRLARDGGDQVVLRAARARVVQAAGRGEMLPTMRRVLESFDRAVGAVAAPGAPHRPLLAS